MVLCPARVLTAKQRASPWTFVSVGVTNPLSLHKDSLVPPVRMCISFRFPPPVRVPAVAPPAPQVFATQPLSPVAHDFVVPPGAVGSPIDGALPFDLRTHPCTRHPLATKALARMAAEMRTFAAMYNEGAVPNRESVGLKGLPPGAVMEIVQGQRPPLQAAVQFLQRLREALRALKASDSQFVHEGIAVPVLGGGCGPVVGRWSGRATRARRGNQMSPSARLPQCHPHGGFCVWALACPHSARARARVCVCVCVPRARVCVCPCVSMSAGYSPGRSWIGKGP